MQQWEVQVREAVRQTLADYTAATDTFDLDAVAACFTADGVLEYSGGTPLTGPAAIEAGLGAQLSGPQDASRRLPTLVRHHVSSVRFRAVAANRAEVASYFAVYTDIGLDHWGRYRDVLVPIGERWLFARRSIRLDAFSSDSLMAG